MQFSDYLRYSLSIEQIDPMGSRDGALVRGMARGESTRLPPLSPRFDSQTRCHMWVEFVVDSRPAPKVFLRVLRFSF